MDIAAVLLALVTLAAGVLVGWYAARARAAGAAASVTAATAAERDAARVERDAARAEVAAVREDLAAGRAERAALLAELRAAEVTAAQANSRMESLHEAQEQLKATFAQLSADALAKSNERFLDLADAKFKQAGAPLSETLTKVELQLREIEKERAGSQQALLQQIEHVRRSGEDLKSETAALVSALRKPQARGRWGELQLRRCVEFAGMSEHCDFDEQASAVTSDGLLRPDMVVRLVGGKSIVIDSKVTLAAYLEAHDATDDLVREERLAAHARHLRQHVDQLAAKSYWSQFTPAPEFVVLFVPGDAFLSAALDRDPDLLEHAFGKQVHIATPTTLISVLRTCAYAWQQDALAANAKAVFDLGKELYKRLGTFGGHMDKLGRSLESAVNTYNKSVGSLEKQVLVTARKLNELDFVAEDLALNGGVEEPVRPLAAPELVASAEESQTVVALPALPALPSRVDTGDLDADFGLNAGGADAQSAVGAI